MVTAVIYIVLWNRYQKTFLTLFQNRFQGFSKAVSKIYFPSNNIISEGKVCLLGQCLTWHPSACCFRSNNWCNNTTLEPDDSISQFFQHYKRTKPWQSPALPKLVWYGLVGIRHSVESKQSKCLKSILMCEFQSGACVPQGALQSNVWKWWSYDCKLDQTYWKKMTKLPV